MTTDDEWADALRLLSRAAYPAGDGPDPALVVRAGRRRKAARRAAGTAAACALVAALALGVPPLLDRADHTSLPITTPGPATPTPTTAPPSPSPTPSSPFPGLVTPPIGPADATTVLFGTPVTLGDVGGVPASIIGPGDGTVLPVAVTPTAYDPQSDVFPSYRSGFGLWTPGGSINWITKPPSAPQRGPQTVEAAVSADWIAWFESDFANSNESPYVLWARPRSGGTPHELARSPQSPDPGRQYGVYDHRPVIVGGTLFWYDVVDDGGAPVYVVMSAPLDGSVPATVVMRNALTLFPDRCSADAVLFVVIGTDRRSRQELHRIRLSADGSVVSDRIVDGDLTGAGEDVNAVTACGDTVVVAHDIDRESANGGSWVEIRQAGLPTRSIVWAEGSGSSTGEFVPGPGFVTWRANGGAYNGETYLYDLTDRTLHQFGPQQAVSTDGTFVWWYEPKPGSQTLGQVAARIATR